jgi:RNA polymerase sigma-70 factor (ECF subfamily)
MIGAMMEGRAAELSPRPGSLGGERDVLSDRDRAIVLRRLVEEHFDFVWRSLRRVGLSSADADDATQEAFVVVSRRLGDLMPGRERAFLFATALRVAATSRRGARREQSRIELAPLAHGEPFPPPDRAAEAADLRQELDRILGELELELRTVLVLYELEELSVPEIADLLELKPGTVASRLRRAREAFRAAVGRLESQRAFRGGRS